MWLSRAAHLLSRVVNPASRVINSVGVSVLAIMMLLTAGDVLLRYFFNRPIPGSFELTAFMMAIVVSFGLAYTAVRKGHVNVELVVSRLPQRAQAVIYSITGLISLGLFSMISWQCILQAKTLFLGKSASEVLYIPVFPFLLVTSFGFALLTLAFLVELLNSLTQAVKR